MVWWSHLSALGGLNVTALLALAIGAWLVGARSWRLALAWCLLFGAALALSAASQMAFIGWGVGIRSLAFTGFSGHAARAAAVFPVALYLLADRGGARRADGVRDRWHYLALLSGALLAVAVALARVKVGAHTPSEAVAGCLLGLGAAGLFVARTRAARDFFSPQPLLLGLLAATILLPVADPLDAHQWLTAAALKLSGRDRVYLREQWGPAQGPYVPPCASARVRFDYLCT
ncbi:phosphatase PAP2 family protein [Massilia sp. 9096]|uniref:phosphatase PAP2 family protein n=1 Tax=Massilia sp. 9096 TaxID=1500894 RepID=UPI00056175C1|nr:phosphatase PAP2 family protein [Massilia sp. 9096]